LDHFYRDTTYMVPIGHELPIEDTQTEMSTDNKGRLKFISRANQ